MKQKEIVRLREKELANGTRSLYLDIYLNGKRKYEFLKLYLLPETSREAKAENKRTMILANAVKAKRIVEIQNDRFGFEMEYTKANFVEWLDKKIEASKQSKSTKTIYKRMRETFVECCGNKVLFAELDKNMIQDYYDFLCDTYGKITSANVVFNTLKKFINVAIKEGVITRNPTLSVDKRKGESAERMYLTIEEIKTLSNNLGSRSIVTKKAFLFSCLTGIRYSDVRSLRWDMIMINDDRMRITFSQRKTKGILYLDINKDAKKLVDSMERKSEFVFPKLYQVTSDTNAILKRWMNECGINKHITFHCARHSFAVMMIELGVDIYTISKLLGHKDISTTQIYAKMVDKRKREAVDLIPTIF